MPEPITLLVDGQPRALPAAIRNSDLLAFHRLGGDLQKFASDPITQGLTLACALLRLPGTVEENADRLPPVTEVMEALTPLLSAYGKKAPAPGPSDVPMPGTPGA